MNELKGMRYNLYVCNFLKEIYISPELTLGEIENLNQASLKNIKLVIKNISFFASPTPNTRFKLFFFRLDLPNLQRTEKKSGTEMDKPTQLIV